MITLECIDWFIKEHGYSPTYRELGELLNIDTASAFKRVTNLIIKGYVSETAGKFRTLKVVKHD
jgi:SOS-response transcriptional repressor LexA